MTGKLLVPAKVQADRVLRGLTKRLPRWPVPTADAPLVACCVYRSGNQHHVERMLRQLPEPTDVRLHALDGCVPTLEKWTFSEGSGGRTTLLQELLDTRPRPADAWVLLFDDDVEFALAGRSAFLDLAVAAEFDIAGAAIDVRQHRTYGHTLVGRASVARTVPMVEIGPVVAFSPTAAALLLPLPDDFGMGWGLDIRWSRYDGLRRGYVDATPVLHFGPVGASYDPAEELARFQYEMANAGLVAASEVARTLQSWRVWQRRPPWLS